MELTGPASAPESVNVIGGVAFGEAATADGRIFFPNLDGLRFAAFLLVYLQHGFGVPRSGGFGVAFFFVLSGFLISYLILAEIDRRGRLDVRAFYVRRVLRIWPLYYAVLAFCFVAYPTTKLILGLPPTLQTGNPAWYVFFLSNFDVLHQAGGAEGAMSTNVTWSVAIEEQFYLTWPLLFRLTRPKRHLTIFLVVISASLLFRLAHVDENAVLYFHSLSVISDMAIGGLAAYGWRHSPAMRRAVIGLPGKAVLAFYIAAGVILGGTWLGVGAFFNPFQRILIALVFAGIVLEQNFCPGSAFKMSRMPRITRLGRYTYGLYLLHAIILTLLNKSLVALRLEDGAVPWLVTGPVGLAASIGAAWCSFRVLEQPFLRLKDRFAYVRTGGSQ